MDIPLQITFRGTKHTPALEAALREHAAGLEKHHPHVASCHAVLELADRHRHNGKNFVVRLDIKVRGGEVVVNHDRDEEPAVAVREAFRAAGRQLEDLAQRQRGR